MSDENQLDSFVNTLSNAGGAAEDQLPQLEQSLDDDNSSMFRDSLGFRHGDNSTLSPLRGSRSTNSLHMMAKSRTWRNLSSENSAFNRLPILPNANSPASGSDISSPKSPFTPHISKSFVILSNERSPPELPSEMTCGDSFTMPKRHKRVPSEDSMELGVISAIAATHSSMFPRTMSFPCLSGTDSWRHMNSSDADHDDDDVDDDDDDWIGFKASRKASSNKGASRGLPKPRSRNDLSGISQSLGQGLKPGLHVVESPSESLNNDYNFDSGCFESDEDGTRSSEMACSLRQVTCEKMDIGNIESDSEVFAIDELTHKFDLDASVHGRGMTDAGAVGSFATTAGGNYGKPCSLHRRHSMESSLRNDDGAANISVPREAGATLP